MGDYHKEEFSPEELAALGEAEEKAVVEDKGPETQEATDKPAEEKAEEAKPEETEQAAQDQAAAPAKADEEPEEKIDPVQKRINKLTFEKNEERRKRDLAITLGPEKFFELYPEDKPDGWQPPPKEQPKPQAQPAAPVQPMPSLAQLGLMQVKGGTYDGWTLNDVAKEDPMAAIAMRDNFLEGVKAHQRKAQEEQAKGNVQTEINTFASTRAFELFGKSVRQCTATELARLDEIAVSAIDYLEKSGSKDLPLEHAYWAMQHEAKRAKAAQAKEKLDKVTGADTVRSIGTGKVPGVDVEWESYLSKSPDQISRIIDKMPVKEYAAFLKDAPKAVRDKFKSLPWD